MVNKSELLTSRSLAGPVESSVEAVAPDWHCEISIRQSGNSDETTFSNRRFLPAVRLGVLPPADAAEVAMRSDAAAWSGRGASAW